MTTQRKIAEIIYNDVYADRPKVEIWTETPKRGRIQVYQSNETYVLPEYVSMHLSSCAAVKIIHNF